MYVLWVWWSLCKRFHGQFTETPEDKEGVLLQDVAEHPLGHLLPLLANPLPILSIQLVQGCNHNVIKLDLCMVDAKTYLLPSCVIQVMYGLARDSIYICIYWKYLSFIVLRIFLYTSIFTLAEWGWLSKYSWLKQDKSLIPMPLQFFEFCFKFCFFYIAWGLYKLMLLIRCLCIIHACWYDR